MKYIFTLIVIIPLFSQAQPKKTNTITVTGVTFNETVNKLLDAGFIIEKSDSTFKTIKTEYKTGAGSNKWMKLSLNIRVKDSIAYITGKWYNTLMLNAFDKFTTIDNEAMAIANTYGNPKACFKEMDVFALSFKKPVEYSIVK